MKLPEPTCPGVNDVVHPPHLGPMTVVCGVITRSNVGAEVAGWTDAGDVDPLVSARNDPTSLLAFCCGDGVTGSPRSYTNCPIWEAHRIAEQERRQGPGAMVDREAQRRTLSPFAQDVASRLGEQRPVGEYVAAVQELDEERLRRG